MIKTFLAAIVAGAFLISVPVHAEEKAPAAGEKAEKPKKQDKKKKDEAKKEEKAAGGW